MAVERSRRRIWWVVAVAVATLVVAEVGVRIRSDVLPEPPSWFGPEMPIKERQIDALAERGGATIIAVGSSHVDVSFDPSQIRPPRPSDVIYNAATGAGSLRMIDVWTRLVAVPRLRPDVVVVGLASRELNPNDPAQAGNESAFFASPAVEELLDTETVVETVERRIAELSELFRYRKVIREADNMARLLGLKDRAVGRTYGDIIANDGQYEGFLDRPFTYNARVATEIRRRALHDYDIGEVQVATLRRLLAFLDANVEHVLVVNMPVTPQYVDAHPAKRADYDRYVEVLEAEVGRSDAAYLDLGIWPSSLFSDPAHLNRAGSRRLNAALSAELDRLVG